MRRAAAAVLALLLAAPAGAAESAAFLRLQPGARPLALGGAFTAIADDLNALTTNPSGLSRAGGRQAGFMHAEMPSGGRYDLLAYAQPAGPLAVGLGFQRLSEAGLDGRDQSGRPTGSFGASDTALSAAVSARLPGSSASAGLGVKLIESRLADASARTAAVDLGVQGAARAASLPLMLGASVRNLGPGLRLGARRDDLPLTVSAGAGLRVAGALLISADLSRRPYAHKSEFCLGSEFSVLPTFSLRGGYMMAGGLGFGFGLQLRRVTVDYGFAPAGELGATQRISLSSRF